MNTDFDLGLGRLVETLSDPKREILRIEAAPVHEWGRLEVDPVLEQLAFSLPQDDLRFDVEPEIVQRTFDPPTSMRPLRVAQWRATRLALAEASSAWLGPGVQAAGFSLSHSSVLGVAAARGILDSRDSAGVGLDIELLDRRFSASLAARIGNANDEIADAPKIALWSLKEAVYKAIREPGFAFRQMEIALENGESNCWRGQAAAGSGRLRLGLTIFEDHVVAVAIPDGAR